MEGEVPLGQLRRIQQVAHVEFRSHLVSWRGLVLLTIDPSPVRKALHRLTRQFGQSHKLLSALVHVLLIPGA
jgi:hypothetical protein